MARTAKRYLEQSVQATSGGVVHYNVGIYSRLSVDHDDKKSESIENQVEIIKQFMCFNNKSGNKKMELVMHDTYIDRGVSGASFKRSGFERLMEDVRNHSINCIIVKDLSRFGRDYLETGNYIEKILPFLGVRFIAVTDGFDSMSENASDGRLAMNIKNLVNDMYAKDISKRVAIARKMSAERGSFNGSIAPYGYEVVNENGIRKLCIIKECAQVIQQIFDNYHKGKSYNEIIEWLYENKIHRISDFNQYGSVHCKHGEVLHQWSPSVIRKMLCNQVYIGMLVQCKSSSRLYEGQMGVRKAGEDEWVIAENSHEAIIDKELFDRIQCALNSTLKCDIDSHVAKDTENIFRNLIYCGNCGKQMHATVYKSRLTDKRNFSYLCREAYLIDKRKCVKNYIREQTVVVYVWEQLKAMLHDEKVCVKDLTEINRLEGERKKLKYATEEKKITETCESMKKQAATIYMKMKEGSVSREEYFVFKKNKEEYDRFADTRLEEIKKKVRKIEIRAEKENKFLRSLFKVCNDPKLNIHLVESLIEKVLIYPSGVVDIVYKISGGIEDGKR